MKTQVCIIGSGIAGSTVAETLLDAGVSEVTMVECGAPVKMRDSRVWHDVVLASDPPNPQAPFLAPFTLPQSLRVPLLEQARYAGQDTEEEGAYRFDPSIRSYLARGGSTIGWDGWCFRFMPEDFRLQANTGRGIDWPVDYAELEPYYLRAEATLQVSGDAGDAGHPPRSAPYAMGAFPYQRSDQPFLEAMQRLGYSAQHMVVARNTQPTRGMVACQNTGTCAYCPIGGRFTGDQALDRLERRNGFKLLTGVAARRFSSRTKHQLSALEVVNLADQHSYTIEAEHFVLCAGAIESPKLLLASHNEHWPQGLCNDTDQVGRFLMNHPMLTVQPPPDAAVMPGNTPAEMDFPTAYSRHFDSQAQQPHGKFSIGYLTLGANVRYQLMRGKSSDEVRREMDAGWPLGLLFITTEQLPAPQRRVQLAAGQNRFGLARTRIHYELDESEAEVKKRLAPICREIYGSMGYQGSLKAGLALAAHPMGTCRMGTDAAPGVVDANLSAVGIGNLSICGTSVYPTGAAVNPSLTLVALAHRLGDHLAKSASAPPG